MCVRVLSIRFCLSYGRSDTKAISRNVKKESCHFRKCMLVCTHVCTQFQCKSNNLLLIKRIWCACASVCGVCILITRTLSTGVVPFTWSLIAIHLYSWYAVFVIRLSHCYLDQVCDDCASKFHQTTSHYTLHTTRYEMTGPTQNAVIWCCLLEFAPTVWRTLIWCNLKFKS